MNKSVCDLIQNEEITNPVSDVSDLEEGEIVDDEEVDISLSSNSPPKFDKAQGSYRSLSRRATHQSSPPMTISEFVHEWSRKDSRSQHPVSTYRTRNIPLLKHSSFKKIYSPEKSKESIIIYDDTGRRKIGPSETSIIPGSGGSRKNKSLLKSKSTQKSRRSSSLDSCSVSSSESCNCSFCSCSSSSSSSSDDCYNSCSKGNYSSLQPKVDRNLSKGIQKDKDINSTKDKSTSNRKFIPSPKKLRKGSLPSRKSKHSITKSVKETYMCEPPSQLSPLLPKKVEKSNQNLNATSTPSMEVDKSHLLPCDGRVVPGSLGEMLLRKQLTGKIKCHLTDKPSSSTTVVSKEIQNSDAALSKQKISFQLNKINLLSPKKDDDKPALSLDASQQKYSPSQILSDEEDELTLRYKALQSTLRISEKTSQEKLISQKNFPSVDTNAFENSSFPLIKECVQVSSFPENKPRHDLTETREDISMDIYDSHVDDDPVDMEISSNNSGLSDNGVEDELQEPPCVANMGETKFLNSSNNSQIPSTEIKLHSQNCIGDSQIPVEWAYMMPPPPPPDVPDNNLSSINKWCYNQNMFAQTIESFKDIKSTGKCLNDQSAVSQNNSEGIMQPEHPELLETVVKDSVSPELASFSHADANHLNKAHAESYKAFMTSFLMRSNSCSNKESNSHDRVSENQSEHSSAYTDSSLNYSAQTKEPCVNDDEDEDLLLAQLLIDQAERDKAKTTQLENSKNCNRKTISSHSKATPTLMGSLKTAKSSKLPLSSFMSKGEKKGNRFQLEASDSTHYEKVESGTALFPEFPHLKFPPIKPVIIPLNSDSSDSEDELNAPSSSFNYKKVDIDSINELIKHARNSKVYTNETENSYANSQTQEGDSSLQTSKAVDLLSHSMQEKYRILKEKLELKSKELEERRSLKPSANFPSSFIESEAPQIDTDSPVIKSKEDEQSSASPLDPTDDEDELSLRNLLLKSLASKQVKESLAPTTKDGSVSPPNHQSPSGHGFSLTESPVYSPSQELEKNEVSDLGTVETPSLSSLRNPNEDSKASLSNKSSLSVVKESSLGPLHSNANLLEHQYTLFEETIHKKPIRVVSAKDMKILKKTEDELCDKRNVSQSIFAELISCISEIETDVKDYKTINKQIEYFKSQIGILSDRLLKYAPNIIKKMENVDQLQNKFKESKESIKHWEAIVLECGKKAIGSSYQVSSDPEWNASGTLLTNKISTLVKNAQIVLAQKRVTAKTSKKQPQKGSRNVILSYAAKQSFKKPASFLTDKSIKSFPPKSSLKTSFSSQSLRNEKNFKIDNRLKNQTLNLHKRKLEASIPLTRVVHSGKKFPIVPKPSNIPKVNSKIKTDSAFPPKPLDNIARSKILEVSPIQKETSPSAEMDILCPYDLLGRCNDDLCVYQHLSNSPSKIKLSRIPTPTAFSPPHASNKILGDNSVGTKISKVFKPAPVETGQETYSIENSSCSNIPLGSFSKEPSLPNLSSKEKDLLFPLVSKASLKEQNICDTGIEANPPSHIKNSLNNNSKEFQKGVKSNSDDYLKHSLSLMHTSFNNNKVEESPDKRNERALGCHSSHVSNPCHTDQSDIQSLTKNCQLPAKGFTQVQIEPISNLLPSEATLCKVIKGEFEDLSTSQNPKETTDSATAVKTGLLKRKQECNLNKVCPPTAIKEEPVDNNDLSLPSCNKKHKTDPISFLVNQEKDSCCITGNNRANPQLIRFPSPSIGNFPEAHSSECKDTKPVKDEPHIYGLLKIDVASCSHGSIIKNVVKQTDNLQTAMDIESKQGIDRKKELIDCSVQLKKIDSAFIEKHTSRNKLLYQVKCPSQRAKKNVKRKTPNKTWNLRSRSTNVEEENAIKLKDPVTQSPINDSAPPS